VAAQRRRARDRKPDNARADDQYLHALSLVPLS